MFFKFKQKLKGNKNISEWHPLKSRLTLLILPPQWPVELFHSVVLKALTNFFFFLALCHVGSWFPNQGSNPFSLHWKRRLLTTGQPGKVMIYDDLYRSMMVFIHHCSLIFWNLWLEFHSLMWMLLIIRMKANDWNNWFHWIIDQSTNSKWLREKLSTTWHSRGILELSDVQSGFPCGSGGKASACLTEWCSVISYWWPWAER